MKSLKEKLKINDCNSIFWLKRNDDKTDEQISSDKKWLKNFNNQQKEISSSFKLINNELSSIDDLFTYFIIAKAIFLVGKYKNEDSLVLELSLFLQNNDFKVDLFINFVNKNPDILKCVLTESEKNSKWEYKDLFDEILKEILKFKDKIKNKDLIIYNLIDINAGSKQFYGYYFFKYNDFIKKIISKDKSLIKKFLSFNFLENKTILEVIKEQIIINEEDFENLSKMIINLIEFSELIKVNHQDEFRNICLFLEDFISKILNQFLESMENNDKLNLDWINFKHKWISKIIVIFSNRIKKSNKNHDFKNKLEIITSKVLELNKKESKNYKNYSKFSYEFEIPKDIIKDLKFSPKEFFELLVLEYDKSFKNALNTEEFFLIMFFDIQLMKMADIMKTQNLFAKVFQDQVNINH